MLEVFTVGRDGGSVGGTLRRGEVRRREVAGGEAAFRVLVRRVGRLLGDEAVVVLFVVAVAATASESAELAVPLLLLLRMIRFGGGTIGDDAHPAPGTLHNVLGRVDQPIGRDIRMIA